jgi:DNA-binding Lrp family transcriptional regulator
MPSAIILVSTGVGVETLDLASLKFSVCVQEVFSVQGAYDLIVKVKTETVELLRECIAKIKNALPKIQNLTTLLVVEHVAQPTEASGAFNTKRGDET